MESDQLVPKEPEVLTAQIERIDTRLRQIEKIAETVEAISKTGLEAATKYIESQTEAKRLATTSAEAQHQKELDHQDIKHKRNTQLLAGILAGIFILVLVSMYMQQYDLVKIILGSSLAVAAGAGLSNIFKSNPK